MDDVDIVPLSPAIWPTLSELFAEGGDPTHCWCSFWRFTNAESKAMTDTDNRDWLEAQAATAGLPIGLVALRDGAAIGWTSLAPRDDFHRLAASKTISLPDGVGVWSVVCFVVGRAARNQGLAAHLLEAAVDFATDQGAKVIEAYPVAAPAGKRVSAAAAYTGLESTFFAAGFERVAETQSKAGGFPRIVVRRTLRN